jgi:hypothetical protein
VPQIFWIVLALFVITDIVAIALVIRRFRANLLMPTLPGVSQGQALASAHTMVGEYLRASYSGDPGHLATALAGLLPHMRELAKSHGIEANPEVLHTLIALSAAKHGNASARQIRETLASIEQAA